MSPFFFGNRCCCNLTSEPPVSVVNACSSGSSSCDIGSTDGEGLSLEDNPYGGSSSISVDPDWGRPGPGLKIVATQSGDDGCFTLIKIDDPFPWPINCGAVSICGEFTISNQGESLRVWPCVIQGTDIYVYSAAGFTSITSAATWKGASRDFSLANSSTDGMRVTGYGPDGVTVSSDPIPSNVEIYGGFLIQSLGTDGEEFAFYLDNVCASQSYNCISLSCQAVTVTIPSGEFITSGDYTTPFDSDCWIQSAEHGIMNSAMGGTFLLDKTNYISAPDPNPKTMQWLNGNSLSDDALIYNSGGQKVWLVVAVGVPVTSSGGTVFPGQNCVLSITLTWQDDNCNLGPKVVASWAYSLDSDDFDCEESLAFSFLSETMDASSFFTCDAHPDSLQVFFGAL